MELLLPGAHRHHHHPQLAQHGTNAERLADLADESGT